MTAVPAQPIAGPDAFPRLATRRLDLREITLEDAAFWHRHFNDAEIAKLTGFEGPADLEAAREEIRLYCVQPFTRGTGIRWGMAFRGRPDLIGTLGYHQWVKEGGNHARCGYDLVREHRRQGLMTEGMEAILDYGFGPMGLNRVEVLTDPRNEASQALLSKLGFRQEGVLRENTLFRGRYIDDVVYGLLARDWRARRGTYTSSSS